MFKFDHQLSYIHAFRLINTAARNGRDPNYLNIGGAGSDFSFYIATIPLDSLSTSRVPGVTIACFDDDFFQKGPPMLAYKYMHAMNMDIIHTPSKPLVAII